MPDSLFTVRRFQARSDLQDAFRVQVSAAVLQSLRLAPGDLCDLEAANNAPVTAIAWSASERPALGPKNAQVSNVIQDLCHLSLGDKVTIRPNEQTVTVPQRVVLCGNDSPYADTSGMHPGYWRRSVENHIIEAGFVWVGMVFSLPRQRRSFRIVKVDCSEETDQLYRVGTATSVIIDEAFVPSEKEIMPPKLAMERAGVGGLIHQMNEIDARLEDYGEDVQYVQYPAYYQPFEGGMLVHGPSGAGKSLLLEKVAKAGWKKVVIIDLYRCESGTRPSQQYVQKKLTGIERSEPSLLILDGLELCTKDAGERGTEAMRMASFLADEIKNFNSHRVLVLGATSNIKDLDPELRRLGCFEHLIEIPPPGAKTRTEILKIIMHSVDTSPDETLDVMGERTHGYVGADLRKLVKVATLKAKSRTKAHQHPPSYEESQKSTWSQTNGNTMLIAPNAEDFDAALREVRPSAMQDAFLETPKVRWSDIGGQGATKEALQEAVEWPFKYPKLMAAFAAPPAKGLLLYGPPGCSKTLTAAALATSSDLNFLAVKGAELLSMYVGESERAVRRVFDRARAAAPSVLFFDEIDAIGSSRSAASGSSGGESSGGVGTTVLTTLLNELDGIEALTGVFVLAATNRPDSLDPALVRPGRLDRLLYVGLPDRAARADILRIRLGRVEPERLGPELRVEGSGARERLAAVTEGYSGAEVVRVCERAALAAVREEITGIEGGNGAASIEGGEVRLGLRHFEIALAEVPRMVTRQMVERYERWGKSMQPAGMTATAVNEKGKERVNGLGSVPTFLEESDEADGVDIAGLTLT